MGEGERTRARREWREYREGLRARPRRAAGCFFGNCLEAEVATLGPRRRPHFPVYHSARPREAGSVPAAPILINVIRRTVPGGSRLPVREELQPIWERIREELRRE